MESGKSRFESHQEASRGNEATGMLGEILVEGCLLEVFRVLLVVLTYYTGAIVLTVVSLGNLRCAPIERLADTYAETRRNGGSTWLVGRDAGRALRAEWVVLTGVIVWIAFGLLIYLAVSGNDGNEAPVKQTDTFVAAPEASLSPRWAVR